jgi:predicted tellurium resistance membrane protein TerC
VVHRFHHLKYGLAIILVFVGAKMLLESYIDIPILVSLAVIITVIAGSIVASLVFPKPAEPATPEHTTGSVFGSVWTDGDGKSP